MNKLLFSVLVAALVAMPAMAEEMHDHSSHGLGAAENGAAMPLSDALVKKVDGAAGKVTLSHGPLPNGMPAMTMAFRLKDRAWIKQLKEGQKIRFAAAEIDGVMTVLRLEQIK